MHILAVTSQEMAAFAVCAAIFALYIAGWFCWLMYRIYKLKRRDLTWLDYSHFIGLFIFMFLLNMMKREYYAGLPLPLDAQKVQSSTPIRLGPATLLNALAFDVKDLKGYIVNVQVPADKLNDFLTLNRIQPGQEKEKDAAMEDLVSSLTKVSTYVFPYLMEDVKSPRYIPLALKSGEGVLITPAGDPGIRRIYLRLVLRAPVPAEAATPAPASGS